MQRFLELAKRWPYLPHFRVVAEFESLSKASRRFGISSAGLSKAVRALEKHLDIDLFERAGGKLKLNDQGRLLLETVRGAMRDLDDVIARIKSAETPQLIRVGVDGAWTPLVIPPPEQGGAVELVDAPVSVVRALLRGDVDVAIHAEALAHREVDTLIFANMPRAVCVAADHPLARVTTPTLADLAGHAFVLARYAGATDGWPTQLPRNVALTTSSLSHAVSAVAGGKYAGILPSSLARRFGLRAFGVPDLNLPSLALWGTTRRARAEAGALAARWRETAAAYCVECCTQ